jgi:glycosyltransferase involved in cell wall biosynthesis
VRIAVIHPSFLPKGGAERAVVWLCDALVRRGHTVTLVTSDYDEYWGVRSTLGFAVIELKVHGDEWRRNMEDDWRSAASQIATLLPDMDVVNAHNFPSYKWAQLAREQLPAAERPPIVWFCHEPLKRFYSAITDADTDRARAAKSANPALTRARELSSVPDTRGSLFARSLVRLRRLIRPFDLEALVRRAEAADRECVSKLDLILTNSQFTASNVERVFGAAARECHSGLPAFDLPPSGAERRPFLLAVTRLNPEKNLDMALLAIAGLRDRGPLPFEQFVVVGDGPDGAYLHRLVGLLRLEDVVTFRGFVPDGEVSELYRTAGAVIHIPLDEPFGLVFLEAAQYRKCVIAPASGGPAEIVVNGETGLVVDPLDAHAVGDAIAAAFMDGEASARLGDAAYERFMREFTFERFADRFEGFVEDMLERRRLPSECETSGPV